MSNKIAAAKLTGMLINTVLLVYALIGGWQVISFWAIIVWLLLTIFNQQVLYGICVGAGAIYALHVMHGLSLWLAVPLVVACLWAVGLLGLYVKQHSNRVEDILERAIDQVSPQSRRHRRNRPRGSLFE